MLDTAEEIRRLNAQLLAELENQTPSREHDKQFSLIAKKYIEALGDIGTRSNIALLGNSHRLDAACEILHGVSTALQNNALFCYEDQIDSLMRNLEGFRAKWEKHLSRLSETARGPDITEDRSVTLVNTALKKLLDVADRKSKKIL